MKTPYTFIAALLCAAASAQTTVLNDFKAMPLAPATAKAAFDASKTEIFDHHYMYNDCSAAMNNYANRLVKNGEPYKNAAMARNNATNPAAQAAANDFSDLNSPETQAKIAKMSDAEKMKFAMEIQQRMAKNKNVQQIQTTNKPDPLVNLTTLITQKANELALALPEYKTPAFPGFVACTGLCNESNPACAKIVSACESKVANDFYNKQVAEYAKLVKTSLDNYNAKKTDLEKLLSDFDTQSKKYTTDDIHASVLGVYVAIGTIADRMKRNEKAGALLILDAKNNGYTQKNF